MTSPMATLDNGKRWAILGSIMLGLFLSAMDQTVVGTAMPRIIADMSGLKLYSWVFTSYMLASTTVVPIVGKMGDIYGRKNFFLAGIVIFLIGSMLSGMSQTMVQLIVFRGVQGVGGGFIFANAFALLGDLFTPSERGRYAGIMSSVFGLASVIGPLVGGGITDHLNWRWVFYVNIPLGIVALIVLAYVLPASERHAARKRVDYIGAVALALSIVPLLLGFSWAGTDYAWTSPQVVVPFAVAAVMMVTFVVIERRAEDPVIPLSLFKNPIFAVATAVTFVSGAAMFAGTLYIPLFMQGVLDFSAINAGLVLTPMTLAMVAGSMISGQLVSRTSHYKAMIVSGLAVATGGLFLLSLLDTGSSRLSGMEAMAVVGFGLGLSFPALVLATQNAAPYSMMGVTTSLNQFSRSVGGTIGVAIMGSILTRRLNSELASNLPADVQQGAPAPLLAALKNPRVLLDDNALSRLRDQGFGSVFGADGPRLFNEALASMKASLATSIGEVFLVATVFMATAFVISLFLREVPLRKTHEMPSAFEAPSNADAAATAGAGPSMTPQPSLRPATEHASLRLQDRDGA
ncbi:MAG TPA: MDR family MFS transporter [Dehalococcoidia bacterium]